MEWEDSFTPDPGWKDIEGIDTSQLVCSSVGYIFKDDKTKLGLVSTKTPQGRGLGFLIIPKSSILRTVNLNSKMTGLPDLKNSTRKSTQKKPRKAKDDRLKIEQINSVCLKVRKILKEIDKICQV